LIVFCVLIIGVLTWSLVPWFEIQRWVTEGQRSFQNAMAVALRGIQARDPLAIWTLCSATAAYGFFHAVGPGHGKVLIGGAALASGATLKRLSILTVLSSLAQAATAIILVGSLVFLLQMQSAYVAQMTERWLAPLSYGAIVMIGCVLVFRGARIWYRMGTSAQAAHQCCAHAHGPSVDDVTTLNTTRDAAALIASIAVRPCTGALFVLFIAARFDAFATGCIAVITMGFGTAAFYLMVASSGVAARRLAGLGAQDHRSVQSISAMLHLTGGALIFALSLNMLMPYF